MVETPGCANSESPFETPPDAKACGGVTGRTNGAGVRNATVEDVSVCVELNWFDDTSL